MRKLIITFFITGFSIFVLSGLFILNRLNYERITDNSGSIYIKKTESGFQIIRNESPFYIKGASGDSHFRELAELGGNTIRLYDTLNLQKNLDEANKYGLAVIVDIPIPVFNYEGYKIQEEKQIINQKIQNLVRKYKNHNALLFWNLGNEVYPQVFTWMNFFKLRYKERHFISTFNELLNTIHKEDKDHPVSTSIDNIGLKQYAIYKMFSPDIDLFAFNNFGDIKSINTKIKQTTTKLGTFPYYISEFGSDGWWGNESQFTAWKSAIEQTSTKKAEQINTRYKLVESDQENCLGSLIFFWGNKYECTDTWFSLFKNEYHSEILMEIKKLWNEDNDQPKLIGLDYMLLNGKGAYDNIIFTPNELINSELKIDNITDSLRIEWAVYPDVWFQGWNEEKYNKNMLEPPIPIDSKLHIKNKMATFITPSQKDRTGFLHIYIITKGILQLRIPHFMF